MINRLKRCISVISILFLTHSSMTWILNLKFLLTHVLVTFEWIKSRVTRSWLKVYDPKIESIRSCLWKEYDLETKSIRYAQVYDPEILKLYDHLAENIGSLNWVYDQRYSFERRKLYEKDRIFSENDRILSTEIVYFQSWSLTSHDRKVYQPIKIHDSFCKWRISKKSEKSHKGFYLKKIKLKCKFYES